MPSQPGRPHLYVGDIRINTHLSLAPPTTGRFAGRHQVRRQQFDGVQFVPAQDKLARGKLHARLAKLADSTITNARPPHSSIIERRRRQVSVYQVLPQRGGQQAVGKQQLRLLDIRRIDLHSSGWETFYVKRAVDDWLRDPRLNMGESLAIMEQTLPPPH